MEDPIPEWQSRPRPVTIDIPKRCSQPAVPGAPSFLTSLPPELRNHVYTWLFIRDEPIVYTGVRSVILKLHDFPGFELDSDEENDSEGEIPTEEEITRFGESPNDVGPALGVLLTCAQIYQEAVGILYNSNTFLVSANLHKHDAVMHQISDAAEFLRIVGSQLNLVTKVMVTVTTLTTWKMVKIRLIYFPSSVYCGHGPRRGIRSRSRARVETSILVCIRTPVLG